MFQSNNLLSTDKAPIVLDPAKGTANASPITLISPIFKTTMTIFKSILLTLLYILTIEGLAAWVLIPGVQDIKGFDSYYLLIQCTIQFLVVLTFIYFTRKRSFKHLIAPTKIHWYGIAIVLGIAGLFMQTPLNWVYDLFAQTDRHLVYDFDGIQNIGPNWIFFVLLIPFAEELIFRGHIQNNLQKKYSPWIAIPIAALLFAAIHTPIIGLLYDMIPANFYQMFLTFFMGLISGILFYKSKSVGPAFVCHAVTNLMVQLV